jgi:hypothetical protein
MKPFYTGPLVTAELLVVMLEKHGIVASQKLVNSSASDDNDLDEPTQVLVPDVDYERAWQLFHAERQDEL